MVPFSSSPTLPLRGYGLSRITGRENRWAGIGVFGCNCVNSNCERPLSHRWVERNGIFTPATSRNSW
jgi:hypothetical protein